MPNIIPVNGEAMPKLNRRSLIAGLAASAAFAATRPARAANTTDVRLKELEAKFNAAIEAVEALSDKVDEISRRVRALTPPKPQETPIPKDLMAAYNTMTMEEFRDETHPVIVGWREHSRRGDEREAAWKKQCEEIRHQCGLPEADAEQEEAMHQLTAIVHEAVHTPVATASGILLKLKMNERWDLESGMVLEAVAADIKRLVERKGAI
jgi:hypothetical protein